MPHHTVPSGFQILSQAKRLVRKADRVLRDVSAFEQLKTLMADEQKLRQAEVRSSPSQSRLR